MKICHLTSAHDSYDTRIFQKECVAIAEKHNYEVFLVAPGESRVDQGVSIVGIGDKPANRVKRMTTFTKEIYRTAILIDADLYHFHDPELLHVGMKLKRRGKIVIFDSHENTYLQIKVKAYIPSIVRNLVARCYLEYEKYVCRHIDAVIYPEEKNPFQGIANKTICVDNFPILSEFTAKNINGKKYDVCCAGSLTEERGITNLLKAAKQSNAKVVLAGEFSSDEYKHDLEQLGLLNNVEFKGLCSLEEVKNILEETKIVVSNIKHVGQYYLTNNLPTKVYEAMAMEIPVILSNFPYFEKMIDMYKFGICINPDSVDDLSEKISYLLSDNDLRLKMGENGRKLVEEKFSWEKEKLKIFELYDTLFLEVRKQCH